MGAVSSPIASTTSLTALGTSGGQVSMTATVTGVAGSPAGQVTFTEGSRSLGTVSLDSSGRATLLTSLPIGTHTINADYGGSQTYLPSSAAAQVVIQGIATTTTLTLGKAPAKVGKPLSVVVTVGASGSTQPSGSVRLYDGVEPVGTVTALSDGRATVVWTPVAKGQRSLTARYAGDAQHAGSQSTPVTVRVR
jgi:hypothetical protein